MYLNWACCWRVSPKIDRVTVTICLLLQESIKLFRGKRVKSISGCGKKNLLGLGAQKDLCHHWKLPGLLIKFCRSLLEQMKYGGNLSVQNAAQPDRCWQSIIWLKACLSRTCPSRDHSNYGPKWDSLLLDIQTVPKVTLTKECLSSCNP